MQLLQKKQYILSSRELEIPEMHCIGLKYGYLYVHRKLHFLRTKDKVGRTYVVLGSAYCTDVYPKQIQDDIHSFEGDLLTELSKNWTGRWVMIRDYELITDAAGLMSAFYWSNDSDWMISSSIPLLAQELNLPITRSVGKQGLDWQLLPDTLLPNVNGLFCTQMLQLGKALEVQFIERFSDRRSLTSDQRVNEVTNRLQIALKNIEKFSGREILIALTAGKDSRLVLAAALSANVNFATYTMEHPRMLLADKKLPDKIARKYGFQRSFIRMKKKDHRLAEDYLRFNGGNSKGADIGFYSSGQTQQLPSVSIVIRSGIFEVGQQYGRRTMGGTMESLKDGFYKYYKTSLQEEGQKEAFEKWVQYVERNPLPYIDLRDRLYIEQRVNGWVSAIEQALTINDFDTMQIANCQELISILLYATEKERNNNRLALRMIKALVPDLLNYPINKPSIIDYINIIRRAVFRRLFKC